MKYDEGVEVENTLDKATEESPLTLTHSVFRGKIGTKLAHQGHKSLTLCFFWDYQL